MVISSDIVICGAGIAGISSAYHLSVKRGLKNILLVDERPPLSLTSDKSTECYRNWWPGPGNAMVALMNRSIDLIEELADESGNRFHLNRRGYLYVTADKMKIPEMRRAAQESSALGAGPLRIHTGGINDPTYIPADPERYSSQPCGADLLLDSYMIHRYFPYLTGETVAALHVRRAGWFSAQQLGAYLLEQARGQGVRFLNQRITRISASDGCINEVVLDDGEKIITSTLINAAGPLINNVSHLLGVNLPIFSEVHLKVAFKDHLGIVPRQAPLLIWSDTQKIPWTEEESDLLMNDPEHIWLLDEFPAGIHTRPEGSSESHNLLMLWDYHVYEVVPTWPVPLDPLYPDMVLRGMATMLPGLRAYFDKAPRPVMDGGYYTKTRENRALIGPLPVKGAYVIGALSGYGLMASLAAGELLAAHVTGEQLPDYANAFNLSRYQEPDYLRLLESWGDTGQL